MYRWRAHARLWQDLALLWVSRWARSLRRRSPRTARLLARLVDPRAKVTR